MHDVQDGGDEFGGARDGRLARLQIDLHVEPLGELFELGAEPVQGISLFREVQPPAQADPVKLFEQRPVRAGDGVEGRGEAVEVVVLAIVMEHHAAQTGREFQQRLAVGHPEARVPPRRVGQVEMGMADARIHAQADAESPHVLLEGRELGERVEDDLVGEGSDPADLGGGPGDAVSVDFLAELFAAQARLGQGTAGRAVHVLLHQAEDAPGGEAFQGQDALYP
jgi:hypothetical protein